MKTATSSRVAALSFVDLPTDYTALCSLLLPRPIRSRSQAAEVEAMIDTLAVDEHSLTKDQCDYLEMLCDVLDAWDKTQTSSIRKITAAKFLALLLDQSGRSAAAVARAIGVDRSTITRLLSGERAFTVPQAQALAKHFAVDPVTFLGLSSR